MARQAVAPAAPKEGVESDASTPDQADKGGRRADEITLKVANPLLVHQETPPAQTVPLPVDPGSPHSSPTAKLKVSSLVWNEYSSAPQTPPPVSEGQALSLASTPGSADPSSAQRPKRRRGLILVLAAAIVSAGVIAGVLIPRETTSPQVDSPPEPKSKDPGSGVPEKPLPDVPKPTAAAAVTQPASRPPQKRHVSVTVEPAEATLILDGTVASGHAITLDLVQDKTSHVVQATAPGYLPFKKSFTLAEDVSLRISLKKAVVPMVHGRPPAQPREPLAVPAESELKAKPVVDSEDFGMDLNRPAARREIKKMDEKDPYSP